MNAAQQQTYAQTVLAQVQELNQHVEQSKHQQIRINHWIKALENQPLTNPIWMKNVLEHASLLTQMLIDGKISDPFTKMPPHGPLPTLPRHLVAQIKRKRSNTHMRKQYGTQLDRVETSIPSPPKQLRHQQCQTSDKDDQWEWERVWKGAFERLRKELEVEKQQHADLQSEMKELRALCVAYNKKIERNDDEHQQLTARYEAEIENLKTLHALEIQEMKKAHCNEIQEILLQNDEKLLRRKRNDEIEQLFTQSRKSTTNASSRKNSADTPAHGIDDDFLKYIDQFYEDTLHYTQRPVCGPRRY